MNNQNSFNLLQYIKKIGVEEKILTNFIPNQENLFTIVYSQTTSIPYSNLNFQVDRTNYNMDLDSIFERLVLNSQGGICFELQELVYWVLIKLGYDVQRIFSEVIEFKTPDVYHPFHELLVVKIQDDYFIIDIGFGFNGLRYPMKVNFQQPGEITLLYGEEYQLEVKDDKYIVNLKIHDKWVGLYDFFKQNDKDLPVFYNQEEFNRIYNQFVTEKLVIGIRDHFVIIGKLTTHGRFGYQILRNEKIYQSVEFKYGLKTFFKRYDNEQEFSNDVKRDFPQAFDEKNFHILISTTPYQGTLNESNKKTYY
ncbi:hypothetical protein pb186bvf_000136 [Paramecium bursaria]